MTVTFGSGASPAAEFVRDRVADCARKLQKSTAIGIEGVIRGELADVWEECSQPDWDGYNALPVEWDAFFLAERLLRAFPLGTPEPSVGAEPDGQLTLEWGRSRRRRLSVSVGPDGDLHYAALLGPERTCGTAPFVDEVPRTILNLVKQVS